MTRVMTEQPVALHLRGVLLPEESERDLFIVDGHFTFQPPERASTVLTGGYLVPGLADMHAHLEIASPAPPDASPEERARASARAQLDAGVLAIREPGGPDRGSAGIGPHEGLPRTFTSGRFLAPPGGYFPGVNPRWVREDELPLAVEEEARTSGAWAKVIGDWPGPDGRIRPNYRAAALAEAARRVHAAGARIAIHTLSPEAIEAAIEANVDSIEHGIGLQDEHIAAMAARRITLVPTLTILPAMPDVADGFGLTPAARRALLSAAARHPEMARRALEAGVLVLAGTDAGMGPHGMIRTEVRCLLEAGFGPDAALAAASWAARRFLGLPGIEEGAPADLVAYPDDPRRDPALLVRPSLRILDGCIVGPPLGGPKKLRDGHP